MSKKSIGYLIPSLLGLSLSTHAATVVTVDDKNIQKYLTFHQQVALSTTRDVEFKLANEIELSNGLIKRKYNQYYKGVQLLNASLVSSKINGQQLNWFGHVMTELDTDLNNVVPKLSQQDVVQVAQDHYQVSKQLAASKATSELFIRVNAQNKAELVYVLSFLIESPEPHRPYFIINAHTGDVIEQWDGLTTRLAQGPGGNEKTGSYYYGRDFGSLEVTDSCGMSTANVETLNLNGKTSGGAVYRFTCPVNTYKAINGAYSPLNDAHYFGNVVFNMYRDYYQMSPLKSKLKLRVHYGQNYENAFWDGQQMTFGDGGASLYPLTALDVMAHEVSHGVTEQNSNLAYTSQSGGINEAFSDMAGEVAKFYMNQEAGRENDWMVGAAVMKGSPDVAMRYFQDPTKDGVSIANAQDYNDALDVHLTSGVFNKAFYTLSTNPNWGIKKAFEAFLLANRMYWDQNATFDSAACGVSKAAKDLGYEVSDVIASFKAVGVSAQCGAPDSDSGGKETEITNGTIVNQIKFAGGDERLFFITVPVVKHYPYGYAYLYVRLFNETSPVKGLVDLYVRYDDGQTQHIVPEKTLAAGDEYFLIKKPYSGTYHLLLKGKQSASVNLQAAYGTKLTVTG